MAKISLKWKRKGFTLITALAFTLIVGTVLAGVGTVTMSHYSRSHVEGDYATAISLADAGINAELRYDSLDPTFKTQLPHTAASPGTGSITGVGTYSVYAKDWGSDANPCSGGDYTNPLNDVCVVSTGTVNGISRTIRVRGKHKSVFDEFAIYAISGGTFNGGGSQGQSAIIGDMGTNAVVTFNGSTNTGYVNGSLYENGVSSPSGTNVVTTTDPINFPTVSDWANKMFSGGLTYLQTNNSNSQIKQLKSTDTSLATEPTIAGLTLADVNSKLASAGYTTASRSITDPGNGVPTDTSVFDSPSTSQSSQWRFVFPGGLTGVTSSTYGVKGQRVLFFPPGDYYFTSMDFKAGTTGLVFLTHLGNIHIWIDNPASGPNKADNLSVPAVFTDYTPSKFRIFYNKCNQLNISGNSVFPGGFYAANPSCGPTNPMMNFGGGSTIYGSVITQYFTVGGSTQIVFPNNAGGDPTDFALWFGFKDNWKEVPVNLPNDTTNPVFVDGSKN